MTTETWLAAALLLLLLMSPKVLAKVRLSRARHRSPGGHGRIARRLAKLLPYYEYDGDRVFRADGASPELASRRAAGFDALRERLLSSAPETQACAASFRSRIADLQFTDAYRVPFQFRRFVADRLPVRTVADATSGVRVRDLDGNWSLDVAGSYGVNLLGYDFYKECIDRGAETVRRLGPVLGPYHPVIGDNVSMLTAISGLDQVSFHMSGTEAVMQAVRLARYHSGRRRLVMFCGAYHGWWDGVQPGIGNPGGARDALVLEDLSRHSLRVLETRNDIACVLVNPLQALHPNAAAAGDAMLIDSGRSAAFDRGRYRDWLQTLRAVCDRRGIALIFDEVLLGFRLGPGGAQEYFGVRADLVTYGKTVGGGLPIGVVCGKARLMKRYRDDRPTDVCFARGTFNSHPYVMGSMNAFLRYVTRVEVRSRLAGAGAVWDARAAALNERLSVERLPLRVHNMASVWTVTFTATSRYNWMLQFYLQAEGVHLSWVGTARLIFSHDYTEEDFDDFVARFVRAARAMQADGWWINERALSDRDIRRQVLREMLANWRRGRRRADPARGSSGRAARPARGTAATSDRA